MLIKYSGNVRSQRTHLGTKNPKFEYSLQVRNNGEDSTVNFDETSKEKYLGVLIDNQLKFSKHGIFILKIISKYLPVG